MICKKCGKKFHYCSSCDPDIHHDLGYCDIKCYQSSDEYQRIYNNTFAFIQSLTPDQAKRFAVMMDDYVDHENLIDTIVEAFNVV